MTASADGAPGPASGLPAAQRAMVEAWERHLAAELDSHGAGASVVRLSRTVGHDRIVDELTYRFTHRVAMPWILPGLAPTGRAVEVALVMVGEFAGDRITAERRYWDRAAVLAQLGPLDAAGAPSPANPTADAEAGGMDADLDGLSRAALLVQVRTLREGIRRHRDSTGQDLCWHHPALWGLLPERQDPVPTVPEWPEFMRGCVRYRQSLDDQAPHAPRSTLPYDR